MVPRLPNLTSIRKDDEMKIIQFLQVSNGIKANIQGQRPMPLDFWALIEDADGNRRVEGMILNLQTQQFVGVSEIQGFQGYAR